jgi:hypothetical protein
MPAFVRPKAVPSSHVIAINGEGQVLMNLQDSTMKFPALTGVYETQQSLYLTSLFGNRVGRLDKKDLQSEGLQPRLSNFGSRLHRSRTSLCSAI